MTSGHPLHGVAIAGVYNTIQGRRLSSEGHTSDTLLLDAIRGALADAGLDASDVDGISAFSLANSGNLDAAHLVYLMGMTRGWIGYAHPGIPSILEAAAAIAMGEAEVVVVASAQAGSYSSLDSTAPWTRPSHEFVECWGLFTAAEYSLVARQHMHRYGTTPEQMATVAATIRNNGHRNPDAIYFGRGPYTAEDILNSRMIADPIHLLDCAMTSEGGCAVVLTTAARARDLQHAPAYLLGGGQDVVGPYYHHPPSFDLIGGVGSLAAQRAFKTADLTPQDVDVCEFYDAFSFEVLRQFEAFGFCDPGEAGDLAISGEMAIGGRFPICTDGGLMSFSHSSSAQTTQRVIEGVRQLRGICGELQVEGAKVAMASNAGSGSFKTAVLLLGSERP